MSLLRSLVRQVTDQTLGYRLNQFVFARQIRYLRRLVQRLDLARDGVVVDIGCGIGDFSDLFPADRYLGIDVLPQYVEWAQKARRRNFEVCGFEAIETLRQPVAAAFGIGILHHMDDALIEKGMAGLARKLPVGGRVFFVEPCWPRQHWNLLGLMLRKLDRGAFIRDEVAYRRALGPRFQMSISEVHSVFPLDYHAFLLMRS